MARIPNFIKSQDNVPTSDFQAWRQRLVELHTYPREVWRELESTSDSARATVSSWRRHLDGVLAHLPLEPSPDGVENLEELFRRGALIPPHSAEAGEIGFLRQQRPLNGLSKLVQRLEERSYQFRSGYENSQSASSVQFNSLVETRLKQLEVRQHEIVALATKLIAVQEEAKNSELARKADAEESKLAFQRWFDERQISFDALSKDIELRSGGAKDQLDKWLKDKESDINGAKEALRTSFATESAHTYWATDKFKRHSDLAIGTRRIGYIYMAAVLAIAFAALLFGTHLSQPLWQTPLSVVIPFAIVVIGIVWVGRILGRTYMAHMQLAEDAKERATMIETYIALIRADVIDKTKAEDAQKALFRPAATGLLAGDSGPDTPIELVTKAVSGGR